VIFVDSSEKSAKIRSDLSESAATDFFLPAEPWNSRHGNRGRHLENGDGSMKKQRRIDVFEPVEAVGQTYDDVVHVNSSTRPCVDCTVVGSSPFSFLKTD
jgi:hypothetical protein